MAARSMPVGTALAGLAAAGLFALAAPPAGAMEVGFYGGMTIANLGGDADEFRLALQAEFEGAAGGTWDSERESHLGPAIGGFVAFPFHRDLLFQPEVHYVSRGSEFNWTGIVDGVGIVGLDGVIEASYLEFPLTLRWTPAAAARGAVQPLVLFGPSIGVNLDGSFVFSFAGSEVPEDLPLKGMSFGLVMGGGVAVDLHSAASLLVEGRYTLGLTSLTDDAELSLPGREVAVLAGLSFHFPTRPAPAPADEAVAPPPGTATPGDEATEPPAEGTAAPPAEGTAEPPK